MTNLLELAERCEWAEGPDRELDALIAANLRVGTEHGWAFKNYPQWIGRADGRVHLDDGGPSFSAPAYTASLDAAMTLVPTDHPKWAVTGRNSATCGPKHGEGGPLEWTFAATPALALCAAALKARAAQ